MPAPSGTSRTSPFHWNEEVRPGLRVAFTSAAAGNLALHVGDDAEAVRTNRRNLADSMQLPVGALRFMSQTHSDRVELVGAEDAPPSEGGPHADGMISPDGTVPLAVLVADCVPIVIADTGDSSDAGEVEGSHDGGTGATAVVHAGRAGVANGIVHRAVELLRREGATDLTAWIGPSVCGRCYEVPEDMMLEVSALVPEAACRTRNGAPALDLPAAVEAQLRAAGVTIARAGTAASSCTVENPDLYSHRREPGAGRIAGLVWRT